MSEHEMSPMQIRAIETVIWGQRRIALAACSGFVVGVILTLVYVIWESQP